MFFVVVFFVFVFCCCCCCVFFFFAFICLISVLSPRTKAKVMSGQTQLTVPPYLFLSKPTKQLTDTK